jgi:dolichyl-phosphate-mannose--protein O-mannosyl transferase
MLESRQWLTAFDQAFGCFWQSQNLRFSVFPPLQKYFMALCPWINSEVPVYDSKLEHDSKSIEELDEVLDSLLFSKSLAFVFFIIKDGS